MSTGTSVPRKNEKSRKERMDEAFAVATRGLAVDVPVLLHGSLGGSWQPTSNHSFNINNHHNENRFDPELTANAARDSHHLIAALTVQYIHRLVDAALDVREMQLLGDPKHHRPTDVRQRLPPPPLESLYLPKHSGTSQQGGNAIELIKKENPRKRSAAAINNSWENPLSKPKIRSKMSHDSDQTKLQQQQHTTNSNEVAIDEWVGADGLDMWQNSRARAAYTQHRTVSAQHFIFPVCHDSYVYGRIREVQAAKVNVMEPLLHDTTVWDAIRTEGQLQRDELLRSRRRRTKQKTRKKKVEPKRSAATATANSDEDSEEDNDNAEEQESDPDDRDLPTWPGLDRLLPTHRG